MQTVPALFNKYAIGDVRPHAWAVRMSFDKSFDDTISFFTLNTSQLDGPDLLGPSEDNPLQAWDYYEYQDYTGQVVNMSWTRSLEFPYSVVSARADYALSNTDDYFTPNSTSPISSYILPKRPVRLLSGFGNMIIPQFVGLTQGMPDITTQPKLATFTALDFLTQIYELPIRNTIAMQNVRTDEVLADIFTQFGLAPTQYDLSKGRNTIPFLFFEREQITAGEVIRKLMQAEMGMLWLSEEGIIIFRPRLEQPITPVYIFDESMIVDFKVSSDDQIINQVNLNAELRAVQEYQAVYIKSTGDQSNIVPGSGTYTFQASLQDPCLTVVTPTRGENSSVSWFVATLPDGTEVTSNITVTSTELKTNTFDILFTNTNAFSVDISQMFLWGQPAKVYNRIEPTFDYPPSILKYETKPIQIDNNFIQSQDQAASLALTMLDEYAEYAAILDVEVKGNPALQLADIIELDYKQFNGQYRIIEITNMLQDSKFTQNLKLRHYTPRDWFVLNQSQLDGTDQLAP